MKSCLFRLLGAAILAPIGIGILYFYYGDWNDVLHGIVAGIIIIIVAVLIVVGLYLVISGGDVPPGDDQCL